MDELDKLPNIGTVAARKLRQVGVETPEQLAEMGSREAFMRLKLLDPGVCLHMLYDLEGAVRGVRKNQLSDETKRELKGFFESLK
ncbi:TfoX/Sxy family protein [Paenibacillus phocaensis]|uniref:TfoX/Sxy family protein n=1 Tax=Paenibacillus phocaensis TaxID=1776378 RepID=UPI000839C6B9|nr:TfoX/Sxy family protein [Paenibacillus phocaensis]